MLSQVLQVDPNDRGNFARQIVDLALQNEAGGMVVGFPLGLHIDNALTDTRNDTLQARRCRNLANTLALLSLSHNIQVFLYGESTHIAVHAAADRHTCGNMYEFNTPFFVPATRNWLERSVSMDGPRTHCVILAQVHAAPEHSPCALCHALHADESGTTKDAQLLSGVRGSDLLMRHDLGKPVRGMAWLHGQASPWPVWFELYCVAACTTRI